MTCMIKISSMKLSYQRALLILGTGSLLILAGWCCFKVRELSLRHAAVKKEYSLVNNIKNGLLSVEVWRDHFIEVTSNQIEEFRLTPAQKDTLRQLVGNVLHSVVNKVDTLLEQDSETIGGELKKFVANLLIDEEKLHERVPEFTQTIVNELLKNETRQKLKQLVQSKLKEFGSSTYDSTFNEEQVKAIMNKYEAETEDEFNKKMENLTSALQQKAYNYMYITLGVIGLFLALWWLLRNNSAVHKPFYIISVLLALEVLLAGVTTHMIEIDARIKSIDFQLIGAEISFSNQVIFFQSKSIVDVVTVLLKTGKYDSIIVGVLILVFSIVFPVSKLLSTGVYLLGSKKWKQNKIVKFFAFKSGKWSMADVNVIAIFMAYIGFKGILDDQLANLNIDTESLTSISTNETSLQPGYILFIVFVLFGLLLSLILEKITNAKVESSPNI